MRVIIEPLSNVPEPWLKDHLLRYGLDAAIIDWKYFDRSFRPKQERGYAWIRNDRVSGTVGMIPFTLAGADRTVACAWTCDWFVESSRQNPGIGIVLLKTAIERAGLLVSVGGNEATSALVPRMAAHTDLNAGREMAVALRLGGTRLFGGIAPRLPIPGFRRLGAFPLPARRTAAPAGIVVTTHQGVGGGFVDLLAETAADGWTPAYDMTYLEWQLARCPAVESATTCAIDGGRSASAKAAAVFWCAHADRRRWRVVLCQRPGDEGSAAAVLRNVIREASKAGGQALSAVVGRHEIGVIETLAEAGFRPTGRSFPTYVLSRDSPAAISGVRRLDYLDSDLGHRF